jgi:hypothetical protein
VSSTDEPGAGLPRVDEHSVLVRAAAPVVWAALGASMPGSRPSAWYAVAVGAADRRRSGDPLITGATLPGFSVREAVPGRRLVLTGRHRFSDYALVFTLDDRDGGTRLAAESRARFPGTGGRVYRALVIGSGAHRLLVRRWLRRIRSAAETGAARSTGRGAPGGTGAAP